MVAVDEEGRPKPVPALLPETEDEVRRQREAEVRRKNRLTERDQLLAQRDR
jgi:acyl-CoA hydrolase